MKTTQAPSRRCSVCDRLFVLRQDGMVRSHLGDIWWGSRRQICTGVGRPPKPKPPTVVDVPLPEEVPDAPA